MGVPSMRVGFIRHTDVYVCARRHACTENFFCSVTLHVSCCYGDARLRSSQIAGLAVEEQGRGRQGDFVGGVPRGTGRRPDTKIIRSMPQNSYVCHLILWDLIPKATGEPFPEASTAWHPFKPHLPSRKEQRSQPVFKGCKASVDIHLMTAGCVWHIKKCRAYEQHSF